MTFDQTGQNRFSAEIDRFKVLVPMELGVGANVLRRADMRKMLAVNGDCFSPGLTLVLCVDFSVYQDLLIRTIISFY